VRFTVALGVEAVAALVTGEHGLEGGQVLAQDVVLKRCFTCELLAAPVAFEFEINSLVTVSAPLMLCQS